MLPNLIIIGAMKCGTTSLYHYLKLHPEIHMSCEKELNFFVAERTWGRGLNWYEAQFPPKAGVSVYGEASPAYTNYPVFQGVPERIHAIVPKAKLIYLVRDPIQRLVAHYVHNYASGMENRSLADVLANLEDHYIWRSRYYSQIEQYLPYFSPAQMLILDRDDLLYQRQATLRRIFEFLGVDATFDSPLFDRVFHTTRAKRRKTRLLSQFSNSHFMLEYVDRVLTRRHRTRIERILYYPFSQPVQTPVLDDGLRERLVLALQADVNQLRQFTGEDFSHWGGV